MKDILRYQIWHVLAIVVSFCGLDHILNLRASLTDGDLWGIATFGWFWLAAFVPITHQVYVWWVWRFELFRQSFTLRLGLRAFDIYAGLFSLFFAGRLVTVILLAVSNRSTLSVSPELAWLAAAVIVPWVVYLCYSVGKYFTVRRAYGFDHFDPGFREPMVRQGIFRYSGNAMYIFGLMILYIPGLLLLSEAALIVALFNHLYIWVHYFCTERPDMDVIYGDGHTTDGQRVGWQ